MKIYDRFGRWHTIQKNRKFKKRLSAYGILIKKDKILLIKPTTINRWELPGGGIEKNEILEKGLKREFLEETGFRIKKFKKLPLQTTKNFYADDIDEYFRAVMKFFYIESVGKQNKRKILRHEIKEIKWIDLKSLDKINIYLPYYKIIKEYETRNLQTLQSRKKI